MAGKQNIAHYRRRLEALETERKRDWEVHWRNLAENFMPRRSRFLDAGEETNRGDRRNRLWDGTGILARRTLSSGMQSGLTSPARPWFSLTLQNGDLARNENVKSWLHFCYEAMAGVFSQSNFYDQVHLLYDELGVFGTGVLLINEDPGSVIRCRTLTVGEYCIDQNAHGRVDTLYRRVRMTPNQILQAWPGSCPDSIRRMAENDNIQWLTVLHVIEPRHPHEIVDSADAGQGERKYRSVYMTLDGAPETVLEDSGFFEFPALCPRWNVTASDVYGTSPAMDALSDCLMLQALTRDGLLALEKEVNPPLVALHGNAMTRVSVNPGEITYVSAMNMGGSVPAVSPLFNVRANLAMLERYKERIKYQIKQMFFNDLFMMLASVDKPMTAREVSERNAEKMLMLGPVLDRLRSELFQPLIERVFSIMFRNGIIPEPPPEIVESGSGVSIEFISILAQAQKQAGISAINDTLAFTAQVAQMSPDALDKINVDEAVDQVAEMNGLPPMILRSDEEVAALREQRAQQMAQQQQAAQMAQMAAIAKEGAGAAQAMGIDANMITEAAGRQ